MLRSFAIFAAATLGCALSSSMPMLVGFRVLQGVGGGGLISSAHAAISQAVSLRERGRYQGYISSMFAVASVLGPVLGGWLTEHLSWEWVFFANLPLAAAALLSTHRALRPLPIPGRRRPIDLAGALLLSSGLSALLIAITRAGQGHPWLDAPNLAWLAAAALLLSGYGWRERGTEDPVLPLPLLRQRIVALGLLTQFLAHGTMITLTVMVPLELQLVSGMAPAAAAALLFVAGVGFGMQFPTTLVAIQNATPPESLGSAIAAVNFVRSLGGALGIAVLSTALLELLRRGAPELAGGTGGADVLRALTEVGADGLRARMQPVAERSFMLIFAACGVGSALVLALFRAMPERTLRG